MPVNAATRTKPVFMPLLLASRALVPASGPDCAGQERQGPPGGCAMPYSPGSAAGELHLLDTRHFARRERLDLMAPLTHDFLDRAIQSRRDFGVWP